MSAPRSQAAIDQRLGVIRAGFAARGYRRVAPPVLQPADVFLDRLGDEVRSRIYVFTDPSGSELCLRPEFTIPTCRLYLAEAFGGAGEARLSYDGPVFRFEPSESGLANEREQAGIELIAAADRERADAEVVAVCVDALARAGVDSPRLVLGDVGLFASLIAALDLPAPWRARLLRQVARPDSFQRLLTRLAGEDPSDQRPPRGSAFLAALGKLGDAEARAAVRDVLRIADIQPIGGRTVEEIAERFLEQAADTAAPALKRDKVELIKAFLAIAGAPGEASKQLAAFDKKHKLGLEPALARLDRRLALLAEAGVVPARTRFETAFGRTMDYYTGFVFALRAGLGPTPPVVAAGGRYDRLLAYLGASDDVPAVGAALFLDRLAMLGEERQP